MASDGMAWRVGNLVGVDEAGYGAVAGPCAIGLVVLKEEVDTSIPLCDSKKIKRFKHGPLCKRVVEEAALAYVVVFEHPAAMDVPDPKKPQKSSILCAKIRGIHLGVEVLRNLRAPTDMPPGFEVALCKPMPLDAPVDAVVFDGNYFDPHIPDIPCSTLVKGDDKEAAIAAASVLAKHTRDTYMLALTKHFPVLASDYGIDTDVGYVNARSAALIKTHGYTAVHRRHYVTCHAQSFPRREGLPAELLGLPADWKATPFPPPGIVVPYEAVMASLHDISDPSVARGKRSSR